jgi:hypothetical protein
MKQISGDITETNQYIEGNANVYNNTGSAVETAAVIYKVRARIVILCCFSHSAACRAAICSSPQI